ncbi:MAG: Gfo/Idh/MocA family oxidoreductase [Spirochaetaceae bacterium]|jgi:predicted dehydrogenase|nr:Gfo/Idh/MocA family oxidoreductase [Spirochaetaceae bacterium]
MDGNGLNIAVIGYGYWGPNLVRNFFAAGANVAYIVDKDENRLAMAKRAYPTVNTTTDINHALQDTNVDAVAIALPVSFHYQIARMALLADKHVLVEKPMTKSRKSAEELIEIALRKNKVIMCDHTFLYTGAVKKIYEMISENALGQLQYFDSIRINLGLFQNDVNVIWDLAPHDISILSYITDEQPVSVSAAGLSHTKNNVENIAYLSLFYQSNFIAHINVSWVSPVKVRRTMIGGKTKTIIYDDVEPTEKVKIYDSSYTVSNDEANLFMVDYRVGDIYIPKLDTTEALKNMARSFCGAVTKSSKPESDYSIALKVVSLLEAAEKSLKDKGKEYKL